MKHDIWALRHRSFVTRLLLMAALLFAAGQAEAQALKSAAEQNQNTSWISQEEALHTLTQQVEQLQQQLPTLIHGSSQYFDNVRKQCYFKAIVRLLESGEALPDAMNKAIPDAASLGGEKEVAFTPKQVLRALYNETKTLLSN